VQWATAVIRITDAIAIDEAELDERFIRASGPGGQNVNKLSSAVQLRFDVRHSPSLPEGMRARMERLAGNRLTRDGVLVITAQRFRTQERNRQDARDRLIAQATPGRQEAPVRHQGIAEHSATGGLITGCDHFAFVKTGDARRCKMAARTSLGAMR
jgi:protein subunit release factor B